MSRQSGKFLSDDELFKIQNDLSFLIQENKKLSSLLDQQKNTSVQQTISQSQLQPFLESIQNESVQHEQQQSQQFQPPVQNQHSQQPQHSQHSQPVPEPQFPTQQVSKVITTSSNEVHHDVPSDVKTITIIIDTNKLVYLLLFIIIMIIILKK